MKGYAGRFDLAPIVRGAGNDHRHSSIAQFARQCDERVQVAQRAHGGKDNFVGRSDAPASLFKLNYAAFAESGYSLRPPGSPRSRVRAWDGARL